MADPISRPPDRIPGPADLVSTARPEPVVDSLAERLFRTQSPQRPQSTPVIRLEVDGRVVEGREGQTILEVCRDNWIEIPTLCYEPKLPGFGACRMCVVDVAGEEHPPISCSRLAEAGMVVQTQTEEVRRLRRTNLELIFSDHNAYCLPPCQNKCPSHIDIPGFLKANAEGEFRESARIFKRTIPFPSILGRGCPAPCEEHCRRDEVDVAIAIRDSHRYAGDQVIREMPEQDVDPPVPFELQPKSGKRVAVIGSGPAGASAAYYLLIAGHDVTIYERDEAPGGMLRYGIPEYRLPKERCSKPNTRGSRASAAGSSATRRWAATSASTTSRTRATTRSWWRSAATTRTSWGSRARTPTASSTAWSTSRSRRSAWRTRATPGSASSSSAADSPRWTARGPRSARARRR